MPLGNFKTLFLAPAFLLASALSCFGYTYISDDGPKPPPGCHAPIGLDGGPYSDVRARLIKFGYKPVRHKYSECIISSGEDIVASCKRFPELEYCTSDTGNCGLYFRDAAGHNLQIVTIGDIPVADQGVERWILKCDLKPLPKVVKPPPMVKPIPHLRPHLPPLRNIK